MPADTTTFFLSFVAIFGGLAAYLWHLERKVSALQARLDATTPKTEDPTEKP